MAALVGLGMLLDRIIRPAPPVTAGVTIGAEANGKTGAKGSITDTLDEPRLAGEHPLQPALRVAQAGLDHFLEHVHDYRAVFIKQERVGNHLENEERALIKYRQPRGEGESRVPASIYMRFVQPRSVAGREVIYVAGQNDNRLVAHEGGLLNVIAVNLVPTSKLAMRGNRHPITEFGIEKLIRRMLEKGTRDLAHGDCEVQVDRHIEINGHSGTEIKIIHPRPEAHFDFHIARILIDDELNVPVGYEGYWWPKQPGDEPVLEERYFYTELQLNVGLSDKDFDPANPDYEFP